MLIPKEMLVQATELSLTAVKQALSCNGYTDNGDLCSVEFKGMNTTGSFVYGIEFDEGEEEPSTGNVYVKIRRKAMSKDLEFYAEY